MKNKFCQENGYTVMEMVVTITIMGILFSIAFGVIVMQAQTTSRVMNSTNARWDVRKAMEIIRNDIQELDPSRIFGLNRGRNAGRRLFFRDENGVQIRYIRSGTRLRRREGGGGWSVLLNDVQQNPFRYLDIDLNVTGNEEDVRYIEVNLVIETEGITTALEDMFYVRN